MHMIHMIHTWLLPSHCMHAHAHARTNARTHKRMHARKHMHTHMYTHTCHPTHTHTHTPSPPPHTQNGELVKAMPCKHFYHVSCIDQWLARDLHCPLCKQSILGARGGAGGGEASASRGGGGHHA